MIKEPQASLPESFLKNMGELLGEEYEAFLGSYHQPTRRGIRLNLLKAKPEEERHRSLDFGPLTPVPWCAEGYEYPSTARPSKSLLYSAGLFYIQEPSAMCPAAVLRPQPGQRVLDLCAAPGGKSVQLAGYMQGRGLLVSNDASTSRSRALVKNLELAGVTNAIVLTEMPQRLAHKFGEFFDCILVDAPCSGEGMFRRDADAIKAYTANKPEACAALQREILQYAAMMLKPGGRIVYSTCTFNTVENEETVSAFLDAHPDFELCKITRIWPHKAPGEGHFIALMTKKSSEPRCQDDTPPLIVGSRRQTITLPKEFHAFCEENLTAPFHADYENACIHINIGKSDIHKLYLQPETVELAGLRVARSGWLLGECIKERFVPSQALAMGITKAHARHVIDLPEADAGRYLKGESLTPPEDWGQPPGKPWVLICYKGYPLGWARLVQGRLKNHLPNGWVSV